MGAGAGEEPYKAPITKREQKEARATLAGTRNRVRKRNIRIPLDPQSFADAVVTIFKEQGEEDVTEGFDKDLEVIANTLGESSALDFDRYGNTFFELVFTGDRMGIGSAGNKDEGQTLERYVFKDPATMEGVMPWVKFMQATIRRRPFLVQALEGVMEKLIRQLNFYSTEEKEKLALGTALVYVHNLGPLALPIFRALLDDAKVQDGTALHFLTQFFKAYLDNAPMDDLVQLLRRAKSEDNLLEYFPYNKRTEEQFAKHFEGEGLSELVEHSKKRFADARLKEIKKKTKEAIAAGSSLQEVQDIINQSTAEEEVPEVRLIDTIWNSVMEGGDWDTKNQQQAHLNALKHIKAWHKLLAAFATSAKIELALLNSIQVYCYTDAKMLKLFPQIVKMVYDVDVIDEDTIMFWHRKGSSPKGRQQFLADMAPFIRWLREAEESDSEEDD